MKKLFISLLFLAGTFSYAQQEKQDDRQERDQDRLEQQSAPPAQNEIDRNARLDAERLKNEKAAKEQAEREATQKEAREAKQRAKKQEKKS